MTSISISRITHAVLSGLRSSEEIIELNLESLRQNLHLTDGNVTETVHRNIRLGEGGGSLLVKVSVGEVRTSGLALRAPEMVKLKGI